MGLFTTIKNAFLRFFGEKYYTKESGNGDNVYVYHRSNILLPPEQINYVSRNMVDDQIEQHAYLIRAKRKKAKTKKSYKMIEWSKNE